MQENNAPPTIGKEANRKNQQTFMDNVVAFHGVRLLNSAVNGDMSFSQWEYDCTMKGRDRALMEEVSVRHWKNGQISSERVYYKA